MSNETTHRDDAGDHIDIDAPAEVHFWAKHLAVTPDQIVDAVNAVGHLAADVEMHLKGSRATTNADQEARSDPASSAS